MHTRNPEIIKDEPGKFRSMSVCRHDPRTLKDTASRSTTAMNQRSFVSAEHAMKKKLTRRKKLPADTDRVVPWARSIGVIEPLYLTIVRAGCQVIGAATTPRVHCRQKWCGPADDARTDALSDSQALYGLVGIDLAFGSVLDASGLLKFKRALMDNDFAKTLFEEINAHLAAPSHCPLDAVQSATPIGQQFLRRWCA